MVTTTSHQVTTSRTKSTFQELLVRSTRIPLDHLLVTVVPFTTRSVEGPSTWAGSSDAHVLPAAGEGHMNIMKQQRVPYWVPWPGAIPAAEHIPQHSAPSCESPVLR